MPFKVWARAVACGERFETYPGHREDARAWLVRKHPQPTETAVWGVDVRSDGEWTFVDASPSCFWSLYMALPKGAMA
jgi:hypothetical protein